MKVLYDHQIFGMQKFGGISRYFVELMSNLPKDIAFVNAIGFSDNVYLQDADHRFSRGIKIPEFRGKGRIANSINKYKSQFAIKQDKFELFHPTYYNPYFLKHLKKPYVITVYDMIHEKFSDMFPINDQTRVYKKETIVNAGKVIAISQKTKDDIMELYGLPENRIDVVHLGHSVDSRNITAVDGLPDNYILFVGQRGGYKNFKRFLKAYAVINKMYPEVKLVCTGPAFNMDEQRFIQSLGVEAEVIHLFVSDSQLTFLYQHAICFVYPSLYEGFGIPILEAFASQCPLALSNTSCFPEIARDGGAYFNPYEIDSIVETVEKIISDEKFRKDLITRGNKVLPLYSWNKMAKETADIYRNIIQ